MSMPHPRLVIVVVALALLAAACDRSEGPAATSSPTASVTASPSPTAAGVESTATTSPTPQASAPPPSESIEVASTVQLIDVGTGTARTLYQGVAQRAGSAAFEDDEVVVFAGEQSLRFRLDGSPVIGSPRPERSCREANGTAEVGGRSYAGVRCGSISPDGRSMAYMVQTGEVAVGASGYRVPQHDMWAVNLDTGATTRLQAGLVHCGGCDARYGPRWSPSSRYVAYAEFGGSGRRFLSDLSTGTTRQIAAGNEVSDAPEWSPRGDLIAYSTAAHGTGARLEELAAGASRELTVAWPVRFDAGGSYLYSPAWAAVPKSGTPAVTTTITEVTTGKTLGTLPGAPPADFLWTGATAVTRSAGSNGYLAVLQQAPSCAGTAIYAEGASEPRCIAGGAQGQSTPDGLRVAIARDVGQVGPVHGPGFSAQSLPRYDIDVVNLVGGGGRTVVASAASFAPPLMLWNAAGTHLLVLWPHAVGL